MWASVFSCTFRDVDMLKGYTCQYRGSALFARQRCTVGHVYCSGHATLFSITKLKRQNRKNCHTSWIQNTLLGWHVYKCLCGYMLELETLWGIWKVIKLFISLGLSKIFIFMRGMGKIFYFSAFSQVYLLLQWEI